MLARKTSLFLIVIILIISGLAMYFRCHYYEPISDDLLYQYVLDEHPLGSNKLSTQVTSIGDAIKSQSIQYFYSNGRAVVHTFVQMFAAPWGRNSYCICISVYFICVIVLLARYALVNNLIENPLIWLLLCIAYLYLFPGFSKTWYSIAGGMNYLYPMLPILIFLLLLSYFQNKDKKLNLLKIISLILIGFIAGWSQECFSLPVSVALFIFIILNIHKVKLPIWILSISLWIGTAILVLAPGNFIRLGGGPGIINSIVNGFKLLGGTWLFWLMCLSLLWLRIKDNDRFKNFIKDNIIDISILIVALAFGMVANTLPQSFYGISFFSCIILFKLVCQIPVFVKNGYYNLWFTFILLIGMTVHQVLIIKECRRIQIINNRFIDNYISSPYGTVRTEEFTIPSYVTPFINNWFSSTTMDWLMFTIQQHYGHGQKPLFLINSNENLEKYRIPGIRGIYQAQNALWFDPSVGVSVGDTVFITFTDSILAPKPSFKSKIKRKIKQVLHLTFQNKKKPEYGDKSTVIISETNLTGKKDGMRGLPIGYRNVKDIKISHKQLENELNYEESLDTNSNVQ